MLNQTIKNRKNNKIGPLKIAFSILFLIIVMEATHQSESAVYAFVKKLNEEFANAAFFTCSNEIAEGIIKVDANVVSSPKNCPDKKPVAKNPEIEVKNLSGAVDANSVKTEEKAAKAPQTPFQVIIHKAANQYEVEPAIIKAIIMAESSFNPKAVSHKGARGLMQLMPRTAEYLGVKDSFNPEHNINGGVKYFKKLLNRFDGNVELALAAYNAGSRNVLRYEGVPPFKATKIYIRKVLQYYEGYKAA